MMVRARTAQKRMDARTELEEGGDRRMIRELPAVDGERRVEQLTEGLGPEAARAGDRGRPRPRRGISGRMARIPVIRRRGPYPGGAIAGGGGTREESVPGGGGHSREEVRTREGGP